MTDFWVDLLTSPTILITALLIGTFGEIVKRAINSKKLEAEVVAYRDNAKPGDKAPALWKRLFYASLPAQPVLVGMCLGFIPWLPSADALTKEGFELAGRIATYSLAGIFCKVGYDTIISTVKRMLRQKARELAPAMASDSTPPSSASDPGTPPTDKP